MLNILSHTEKDDKKSELQPIRVHNRISDSPVAVRIEKLSKLYRLYRDKNSRLKEAFHPFRRKYHEEFYALKNIDLTIHRGDVVGIIGKNGSGKSTLLKVIGGVSQPSSGTITVNGNISALLELGAGFNPEISGMENIFFYGSIVGFSKKQMVERIESILEFADIGRFIYQPIKRYSSGMKARLAFSVAIHIDPQILIIDEVLAVGDELFHRKCYAKIEQFIKEEKTILFVSHGPATINELCSKALLIDQGELILEGPPELVTSQYRRLIFSKPENARKVREEIVSLNLNGPKKQEMRSNDQTAEKPETKNGSASYEKPSSKALYLPDLKPKSRVEYESRGVEIKDVRIETLNGRRVNLLVPGEAYLYKYRVEFHVDAENVSFGMQIKSMKGLCISAANLEMQKKSISKTNSGEVYTIEWRFSCKLLPGTYFTNAGVSSYSNGEKIFLKRIEDATVFKVQESEDLRCAGLVSLDQSVRVQKTGPEIYFQNNSEQAG